ncbi:MAG: DUF2314 domain-containing protein [Aquabacterium sp.]|uniref:DUF2314 domain-containing protein n=1 Tax=Aquabacterium sp. TaxID=1872578 RepID=UPI0025C02ECB|nr:DUF2314 domain-containing protein [Aquabacterium sp.]MBI3383134.1 DUF2314 domain-containing protein [Aquabacterium sp.]
MNRFHSFALASLLLLTAQQALADKVPPKADQKSDQKAAQKAAAKPDEVVEIDTEDPAMKAAVKKAQATFDDFIKTVSVRNPNIGNISVRVALRDGKKLEYVWLAPFTILDKGGYKGTISAIPTIVKKYQFSQQVPFKRADVVDWMYTEADTRIMRGNFTTCAQLSHAPESDIKELKKRYGLDCSR